MRSLEGKCSRVVVFPVLSGDRRRCFESSAPPESKSLKCFEFKPLEKLAFLYNQVQCAGFLLAPRCY